MTAVVQMVEAAAQLPAYQAAVLARAPDIARFDAGSRGVFMGYDFHLGAAWPKLIEVNTNAGGVPSSTPCSPRPCGHAAPKSSWP